MLITGKNENVNGTPISQDKMQNEFWVLVSFSFLLTSFEKLAKKNTHYFFTIRPMLVVRKNGDEFLKKIRIRFLSVDHRLSVTKTK